MKTADTRKKVSLLDDTKEVSQKRGLRHIRKLVSERERARAGSRKVTLRRKR